MIFSESAAREFVARRCSDDAFEKLTSYVEHLRCEAGKQNLVSRSSLDHVWTRHIADSAQLLDHVSHGTKSWLDLGSGAGLPGIIVAIMRPDIQVTLVESRRKRFEWLAHLCAELGLAECKIVGQRLESCSSQRFDIISARAFAPLPKLLNLASRFADESTLWLLPKGRSAAEELALLSAEVQKGFHVEQSATDKHAEILVGCYRPSESQT